VTSSSPTSWTTIRSRDSRGGEGAEYVVSTMHGAHPDLQFTINDLLAEGDQVTIR
jgi:predicted ester cyclase